MATKIIISKFADAGLLEIDRFIVMGLIDRAISFIDLIQKNAENAQCRCPKTKLEIKHKTEHG